MQNSTIAFGILIAVFFSALIVLFCVLIVKLYINKIKNYTKLIYQKDIDFQKTLNVTIQETQEQVLNNISQDLHDDAGQQLTYINFVVENLKYDNPALNDALTPLSQSIGTLSSSIRSISHSLNSQLLVQESIVKAIEAEVERLKSNTRIQFEFKLFGIRKNTLDNNEKIVVYRIFQEIINNALKHSGATSVGVILKTEPHFELSVSDNGKGFDLSENTTAKAGMGLKNIINRAGIINFKVKIDAIPLTGTTITLSQK
ncbi:histidine kinase [Flavobacterium sp. DG1-102-2]|uniref:sensor histidine kinase n=1 Tax=Flavobacterium sp. DG1-102-2 TaxID=3081663 RepID=UPI00294A2B09|nr:ATP-binding protein [Flavobacterium sp. DG1-102-2]MDV6167428.1 histidine kinase [Flavobacterium sp. DG1-102-2]